MERAINCDLESKTVPQSSAYILTLQLTRVLCCFDIFLETHMEGEYKTEKPFYKFVRGRNRLRPFKFDSSKGEMYTHY